MKKLFIGSIALMAAVALMPMFAAFEAHVVNVTATIENALYVHPQSIRFGTVFPQEHLFSDFFIAFSQSFSSDDQLRVGTVEYVIKQKPMPRPEMVESLGGKEAARDWCHTNTPTNPGDPNDPYYDNCYPSICPYISKHPDGVPSTGPSANNDVGLPPFHDPEAAFAHGKIVKFIDPNNTIGRDSSDNWTIDLAVPCFKGECAQDWPSFVTGLNPSVTDTEIYKLPQGLEHEVFGCDLWVEVTDIY